MKAIINVKYRGLDMNVYDVSCGEHFVSHCVRVGGGWETEQLDYIIDNISNTDKTMIDVGGEIGTYSAVLSKHFKKIYTFEPNFENHSLIQKTIDDNGITNIELFNKACGSSSSRGTMKGPYSTELDVDGSDFEIVKLDDVVDGEVSFIKIDVEGHEYNVLLGCERIVREYKPVIYLETHPTMVEGSQINSENWLKNLGYVIIKDMSPTDKFWGFDKL